ncbi:maleylpyruvate isomerase N-terminal domain-containing protein [Frondihabitans sucicola]|uniref:maleylpyruvate isomerase N-terminal domain-containing protein n=1 Tax=Frondihabitans sucicola TaxID=1268041 RepID=UPI0033055CA3
MPTCPGWTITDLTRHLGQVHRWAHAQLTGTPDDGTSPGDEELLVTWFDEGASRLLEALRQRDATDPCATIYPRCRGDLGAATSVGDRSSSLGREERHRGAGQDPGPTGRPRRPRSPERPLSPAGQAREDGSPPLQSRDRPAR